MGVFLIFFLVLQNSIMYAYDSSTGKKIARKIELELAKNPIEACTLLEQLTEDPSFRRLQNDERMHIYKMQIAAYRRLKQFQKQEALIQKLLKEDSFSTDWISLKVLLGHSYLDQDKILQALKVSKELLRTPTRRLSNQDAIEVSEFHIAIERHREQKLYLAKQAFSKKNYPLAEKLYHYLFEATGDTFVPSLSKVGCRKHMESLTYRLALCYYLQHDYQKCASFLTKHPLEACLLLHGLAEKKLHNFDTAYELFAKIKQPSDKALWEACYAAFKANKIDRAKEHLKLLGDTENSTMLEALIDIEEQNLKNAKRLLNLLTDPELKYEVCSALYSKGKTPFARSIIESSYPECPFREKVLYSLGMFQELYTEFPDSPLAAESYYRSYPEELYVTGEIQALSHLKKMPETYYKSPYGVIGRIIWTSQELEESSQQKTLQEAVETLNGAIMDGYLLKDTNPESFAKKIVQAQCNRAKALFRLTYYDEVATTCKELKNHVDSMRSDKNLHLLWQEASFLQSRAYLLQGNEASAREELANLLDYATKNETAEGEAYFRALIELANLKARDGELEIAFSLLAKAPVDGIKEELNLERLIAMSQLHRKKGEFDKAMMLLSTVINERSASNLRIQAMYLRAELYESKGRRDLAFRQLQTTAKKGGEWGERAAKKLEDSYGYE